ncbi:AAA family ATPase [Bradyrhizobium japonicum]|uniref:AAA family ATPase n=1 Tax=Bradyrhizobium japonicum TaxID=375 RepID=UPI001BAAA28A|nr:AAA family ATPase [Bradyrhizobium japonicum]MBR0989485.1 AAA family ATPase [Bradyrhizobium japonicum]
MRIDPIKIEKLELRDIGCFEEIQIDFSSRFNLLCGANGVGKSTVLSVVARAFSHHQSALRRRSASSQPGNWSVDFVKGGVSQRATGSSEGLLPGEHDKPQAVFVESSRSVLYFKATRDFLYSRLEAIARDPPSDTNHWSNSAILGIDQGDLKRWLANRYLFSAHPGSLTSRQEADLAFAKECFSILDHRVRFRTVDAASFDTYVDTPQGSVPFEYLSSGFRASLAMLLGIIREIEIRGFEEPAQSFSGVVLIDELDLHLHPTWQQAIVSALKKAYPFAQFIVTTHSPHMIQHAENGEVIALVSDGTSAPRVGKFETSRYGFKGWSLEEILTDVMGLSDTTSEIFSNAMRQFDLAIERDDSESVRFWMTELDAMIHPTSHLRKLIRLQAGPIRGRFDD